jgi:hypothetical protein
MVPGGKSRAMETVWIFVILDWVGTSSYFLTVKATNDIHVQWHCEVKVSEEGPFVNNDGRSIASPSNKAGKLVCGVKKCPTKALEVV